MSSDKFTFRIKIPILAKKRLKSEAHLLSLAIYCSHILTKYCCSFIAIAFLFNLESPNKWSWIIFIMYLNTSDGHGGAATHESGTPGASKRSFPLRNKQHN